MGAQTIAGKITKADYGFGRTSATQGVLLTFSDGGIGVDTFETDPVRISEILSRAGVLMISQLVGRDVTFEFVDDQLTDWRLVD